MVLVKTDDKDFAKDTSTGAVINTNVAAYKLHVKQREDLKHRNKLETEVAALKEEMADIKHLLQRILEK